MFPRQSTIFTVSLLCAAGLLAAPCSAAPESELDQAAGHWIASGVSFQSGNTARPFSVDVERVRDKIQVTLPSDVKLEGGSVYLLPKAGAGVFRHVDDAGRIVELSFSNAGRATLLITGSGGDGRVTWSR